MNSKIGRWYFSLLVVVLCQGQLPVFAQGEWNQWRFGQHISLDFNSGNPVQIANNPLNFSNTYTVSTSDSLGNLLFFSDGKTVWDRNNNVMPNGAGLFGTWAPDQTVFCIKNKVNDSTYFLFTVGASIGYLSPHYGLFYSIIDLRLNNGLGDIVAGMKNIPLNEADSAYNYLYGTRHQNNKDAWILVKQHPLMGTSWPYLAFKVTTAGVDTIPITSASALGRIQFTNLEGTLRISPDGNRLISSGWISNIAAYGEYCNFNKSTGQINPLFIFRHVKCIQNI
jgi:hypothetical protein